MADLVNISVSNAFAAAVLGYGVVFLGLVLLMFVLQIMGKIMHREAPAAPAPEPEEKAVAAAPAPAAPGTAGELKLYDTNPRDAAMIMAIVADSLGKPLNELRFISIREIKEEDQ